MPFIINSQNQTIEKAHTIKDRKQNVKAIIPHTIKRKKVQLSTARRKLDEIDEGNSRGEKISTF